MNFVKPIPFIYHVISEPDHLIISTPTRKHWLYIVWFDLGLVVLIMLQIAMFRGIGRLIEQLGSAERLFTETTNLFRIVSAVFIICPQILLTLFSLYLAYQLSWSFLGRETITLTVEVLSIQRGLSGRGSVKRYELQDITPFRIANEPEHRTVIFRRLMKSAGSHGLITFDYRGKTYRLGNNVEQAEARQMLREIAAWQARVDSLQSSMSDS